MNIAARVSLLFVGGWAIVGCPSEPATSTAAAASSPAPVLMATATATATTTATVAATATQAATADASTASVRAPAPIATSVRPEWQTCAGDAECTFVSLGCCETTPINRAHAGEGQAALDASGRRHCPVKAACGKGVDGTWEGAAGACRAGRCAPPEW